MSDIEKIINEAWKIKDQINKNSDKSIINAINQIIEDLDQGKKRIDEKKVQLKDAKNDKDIKKIINTFSDAKLLEIKKIED